MSKRTKLVRVKSNEHTALVLLVFPRKKRVCIFDCILERVYLVGISDIEPFDPNDGSNGGGSTLAPILFTDSDISTLDELLTLNPHGFDTDEFQYKNQKQIMLVQKIKRIAEEAHEEGAACLVYS